MKKRIQHEDILAIAMIRGEHESSNRARVAIGHTYGDDPLSTDKTFMPNIATLLKDEIIRLSKKTARQHLGPIQSASAGHRHQLAKLKKQVLALEREIAKLRRLAVSGARREDDPASGAKPRFVAGGLKSHRVRLGLSAIEAGRLIGVSGNSIHNWENKKTKPRPGQLPTIAALRGMGKRDAQARLVELASAKPKRGSRR